MPSPPTSFTATTVTSPTSNFSNFPGFTPPFQAKTVSAEMGKSAFIDNIKTSDISYQNNVPERPTYMGNTPGRRAPRMSEHLPFEPPSLPSKIMHGTVEQNHSPEI
jgi:hypothetical protein